MSHDENDPILTAYILGELGESERGAFEKKMAEDPALAALVEEYRATTSELFGTYQAEPLPELDREQQRRILEKARHAVMPGVTPVTRSFGWMKALAATGIWGVCFWVSFKFYAAGARSGTVSSHRRQDAPTVVSSSRVAADAPSSVSKPDHRSDSDSQRAMMPRDAESAKRPARVRTYEEQNGSPKVEKFMQDELTKDRPVQLAKLMPPEQDRLVVPVPPVTAGETPEVTTPLASPSAGPQPTLHPENPFRSPTHDPLSTFSIDVDTASYSMARQSLDHHMLPQPGTIRVEEFLNYFPYDYAPPRDGATFATHVEVASCPWQPANRLVKIGIKGRVIETVQRKPSNLVFLVDVSGSMAPPDRLPLLQQALKTLVNELGESDHISIVTYAGSAGTVLPSTSGDRKDVIHQALDQLLSGGSTHGSGGIHEAYSVAVRGFIPGGVNRVILATDGDFNVGTTGVGELETLIQEKARSGVFLSVLRVGYGSHGDESMETLADKGNGNYAYLDSEREAQKVLVEQLSGTLETIAKDMKVQVEFNPLQVEGYRLIGYENRLLAAQDFNDDRKDAGELGAGHTVTALYEIVPAHRVDALRYQKAPPAGDTSGELMNLKLRFKQPAGDRSELLTFPIRDEGHSFEQASSDFQFASGVALFGMVLRGSSHGGGASLELALELVRPGLATDPGGHRRELVPLIEKAKSLLGH